jgi:hypothetical protein
MIFLRRTLPVHMRRHRLMRRFTIVKMAPGQAAHETRRCSAAGCLQKPAGPSTPQMTPRTATAGKAHRRTRASLPAARR